MTEKIHHPTEDELFAYLDGELDAGTRRSIEAHLAGCTDCSAVVKSWGGLFAEIEAMPELPLARDLAPGVLAGLPRKAPALRFLPLAALVQFAAAAAVLAFALPALFALPDVADWTAGLAAQAESAAPAFDPAALLSPLSAWLMDIGTQALDLLARPETLAAALSGVLPLVAASSLLWIVGNGILIRRQRFDR